MISLKWYAFIRGPLTRLKNYHGQGNRKIVRDRGISCLQGMCLFLLHQILCRYELRVVVISCTRNTWVQVRQNFSTKREIANKSQTYLIAMGRRSLFFRNLLLVYWPYPSGRLPIQEEMGRTNWNDGVKVGGKEWNGESRRY